MGKGGACSALKVQSAKLTSDKVEKWCMNIFEHTATHSRVPGLMPKAERVPLERLPPQMQIFTFLEGRAVQQADPDFVLLQQWRESGELIWLNVEGLGDASFLERIANLFDLHHLAMEDVQVLNHRPKVERYEHGLFIIMRTIIPEGRATTEQLSMFFGHNFFITLQERPSTVMQEVVQRLNRRRNKVALGADELAYETLDALLDEYFPAFETYGEWLERIEDDLIEGHLHNTLENIRTIKREILSMRKALWPMREVFSALIHDEYDVISDRVRLYLRDCNDHVFHLMDLAETYREITAEISDIYVSAVSARLNETMKVLTIIATIFMPLGFIASLYGMNFDTTSPYNMPELKWRFGYWFALGLMGITTAALFWFFWRRGWVGRGNKKPALLRGDDYE